MKINFTIWLMMFLIFPNSFTFACTPIQIKVELLKAEVCYFPEKKLYLSKACQKLEDCFPTDKKIKHIYPNQSPGFTQCYAIKGEAYFATISDKSDKVPFCKLGDHWVDIESLSQAQKHSL